MSTERRRKRSDDPVTALHYQLAHTRAEAKLEALVLVDDAGCLVAGAGAWPTCEELAAYAPLLARPEDTQSGSVTSRLRELSDSTFVWPVGSAATAIALLCARSSGITAGRSVSMRRAAEGCLRILGER